MSVRVLLVDDSAIVRGLTAQALKEQTSIEIVATATDGEMAVQLAGQYQPDVIVLDIEMPKMDGITALPHLLRVSPKSKIIMASTLTQRNASISLRALQAGAADYVAKPSARDPEEAKIFFRELIEKILALGGKPAAIPAAPVRPVITLRPEVQRKMHALAIASSTGGPQALITVLTMLKGALMHLPIFITQHMPPTFTALLAEQLSKVSGRICAEGKEGEVVQAGRVYIAPGNFHMRAIRKNNDVVIALDQGPQVNFCRPSADPMLESLAEVYGANSMSVVLTGIGSDGTKGIQRIAEKGGACIAQDEATSVVYGMPKAAALSGACQAVLPLDKIADYLMRRCA